MYLSEAKTVGLPVPPNSDVIQEVNDYHKMNTVALMLSWTAVASVKLSYLVLFRRLIDRLPGIVLYWRTVLVFNLAGIGFGLATYYLACPYFYSLEMGTCVGSFHIPCDPKLKTSSNLYDTCWL